MKTVRNSRVVSYVQSAAITMALLGVLISSVAPKASAQTGWAVGNQGTVLYTPDGTNNKAWVGKIMPAAISTINFKSVSAVDNDHVWVVGDSGTILYFEEGKLQDPLPASGVQVNLNSVHMVDESHGWAVGDNGTILKVTDGKSWKNKKQGNNNLYGTFFTYRKNIEKYYGWAVGANGTILHTEDGGDTWKAGNGLPNTTAAFRSVSGKFYEDKEKNIHFFELIAVGDSGLGIWESRDWGQNWFKMKKQPKVESDFKVVRVVSPTNIWVGQTADATKNAYDWVGSWKRKNGGYGKWIVVGDWFNKGPNLNNFAVYGLSLPIDSDKIWAVGQNGNLAYTANGTKNPPTWVSQDNPTLNEQQLNSIRMLPPPKKKVQVEGATSPGSGAAGVDYVSLSGSGFPDGNINPGNVVVDLAATCQGDASATTSSASVVSGSGDSELVSFLVPSGLAPGQYFVSISDSAEGDANFESSNCSEVNITE